MHEMKDYNKVIKEIEKNPEFKISKMDDIGIEDVIDHFGEDDLLEEMGYSSDLCFKTDLDLSEEVHENSEAYGIDLQPYFKYNNDKDIYDRVLSLLENDKITYQEWDNFLKKYE